MSAEVEAWHDRGARLDVPGTAGTRIWREGPRLDGGPGSRADVGDEGHTAPVVLLHGVPASAYLYRKVLPELAARGLEGVALDFPGLGFADRPDPADFDYSWTGLSGWLERALDAAGIGGFHLVVHDIGGPIGFDLVRRLGEAGDEGRDRVRSLTVLNTLTRVSRFRKPWVMRPFSVPVVGRAWVAVMNSPAVVPFFRWKGSYGGGYGELRAYGRLLARGDGGRAFRSIMASFENDAAFEARILPALEDRWYPAQVVWGEDDAELRIERYGEEAREVLGVDEVQRVRGKHFVQEDSPAEIAERVATLAG